MAISICYSSSGIVIADGQDPSREPLVLPRGSTSTDVAAAAAAYLPPVVEPDWMGFGIELALNPSISALFNAISDPVGNGLSIGLFEASKGDPRLFLKLWSQLMATGMITTELLSMMALLARQFQLPIEFVTALGPTEAGE
jgi:hypothetical protein